ncbi:hypothetical protein JHK84_042991 [Glycine max]|nr:hypothetical protein JHK84_042991 [Glycine max]
MLILLARSLLSFVYLISDEEDTASVPCNLKGHQQPNLSNGVAASYSHLRSLVDYEDDKDYKPPPRKQPETSEEDDGVSQAEENVSWGGINSSINGRVEPVGLQELKESVRQWRLCRVFFFHGKLKSGSAVRRWRKCNGKRREEEQTREERRGAANEWREE